MPCHSGPIQTLPIDAIWCVVWHSLTHTHTQAQDRYNVFDYNLCHHWLSTDWNVYWILMNCIRNILHTCLCALALRPLLLLLPTTKIVCKRWNERMNWSDFVFQSMCLLLTWEWRKMCATQAIVAATAAAVVVVVVVPQFAPETPAHFSDIICMINAWHQIYIGFFIPPPHRRRSSSFSVFFFHFASFLLFF